MLLDQHITRDGERMLIIEMEQDHLVNMLNLILTKGESLLGLSKMEQPLDPWVKRNMEKLGYRQIDDDTAVLMREEAIAKAEPYLLALLLKVELSGEAHPATDDLVNRFAKLAGIDDILAATGLLRQNVNLGELPQNDFIYDEM